MRKTIWAAAAAAAVLTPLAIGAGSAAAAMSPDTKAFCTVPATWHAPCEISLGFQTKNNGIDEGKQVTAQLRGAPGKTFAFAVFRVEPDAAGKPTRLTRASQPVSATLDNAGHATVTLTVDPIKAPATTLKDGFVVTLADAADPAQLVGTASGKVDQFTVHSTRGQFTGEATKPRNGRAYEPGEMITHRIEAARAGDRYLVQLQVGGQWLTMPAPGGISADRNGVVSASTHAALVSWNYTNLPVGQHPLRIVNAAAPDSPVFTGTFVVVDGLPGPTVPTVPTPGKPTPSSSTTASSATPSTAIPSTANSGPASSKPASASARPAASTSATAPTSGRPSATSTTPPAPTPSSPAPVDRRVASDLADTNGSGNPSYTLSGDVIVSSGKLVDATGAPIAGGRVALYDYRDGRRGAQLGSATTGADGSFRFTATLPRGWQQLAGFNVELAYDGDATHRPDAVTMRPEGSVDAPGQRSAGQTSDTGATSEKPTDAKDSKGGLAKTGA